MSRGPGRVQLAVLAVLDDERRGDDQWLTVPEVAARICGTNSRAGYESIRRAMKVLARSGRVDLDYFDDVVHVRQASVSWGEAKVYRSSHRGTRKVLAAHWPLSVEEREARAQMLQESVDRLTALDERIKAR